MGMITFGIPQQIIVELARLNGSTVFVETGTFHGSTTRWASNHFDTVHTIERAENLYILHSNELAQIKGVTPHFGDSRNILPRIVKDICGQKAIYWLDGHWSGGETSGEYDECPLLDELACLSDRKEDIILVDDARLFLCAPPLPHNPSQWPTIWDIFNALFRLPKKPFVQIVDDVIFIIPDEEALKNHLIGYAQRRSGGFWEEFGKIQGSRSSFSAKLKTRLSSYGRKLAGKP